MPPIPPSLLPITGCVRPPPSCYVLVEPQQHLPNTSPYSSTPLSLAYFYLSCNLASRYVATLLLSEEKGSNEDKVIEVGMGQPPVQPPSGVPSQPPAGACTQPAGQVGKSKRKRAGIISYS